MSITRENAIKILITENFLDKESGISEVFPEIREAVIMAIQSLRAWDLLKKELEEYSKDTHKFESVEWNEGFHYAIDMILDHVANRYLFQIEHSVRKDIDSF